jgi:hypothetical protein
LREHRGGLFDAVSEENRMGMNIASEDRREAPKKTLLV